MTRHKQHQQAHVHANSIRMVAAALCDLADEEEAFAKFIGGVDRG